MNITHNRNLYNNSDVFEFLLNDKTYNVWNYDGGYSYITSYNFSIRFNKWLCFDETIKIINMKALI